MYLEKIKINKFRVLEDLEVKFQVPNSPTSDPNTGNVINVIVGANGTGKSSLLEAILRGSAVFYGLPDTKSDIFNFDRLETVFNMEVGLDNPKAKVIMFPANQSMEYKQILKIPLSIFSILDSNDFLGNAEIYIKEYVIAKEREVYNADPEVRLKQAIDSFNDYFSDIELLTKLHNLDKSQLNRPVFKSINNGIVTIDKLSDGEKQIYGKVIALMLLDVHHSIILIDEPENAIHPAWQQKIMKMYSKIGANNQFIVATHSPQILASVPYQNRILLKKSVGKIKAISYTNPPSGVDVNSILAEIMGADPRPPEILDLYRQYRKLVEERKENTPEAQKIREQLSVESEHSSFMQEMAFLIELRDAA